MRIFLIWHQDYDYAGASLVAGPEDADMNALYLEYREEFAACCSLMDPRTANEKYHESEFCKKYIDPSHAAGLSREFVDNVSLSFRLWLIDKKGFKAVDEKRFEV